MSVYFSFTFVWVLRSRRLIILCSSSHLPNDFLIHGFTVWFYHLYVAGKRQVASSLHCGLESGAPVIRKVCFPSSPALLLLSHLPLPPTLSFPSPLNLSWTSLVFSSFVLPSRAQWYRGIFPFPGCISCVPILGLLRRCGNLGSSL